jgi:hypothetical protein
MDNFLQYAVLIAALNIRAFFATAASFINEIDLVV